MEKITLLGMYDGLSAKKDGLVDIKFKFVSDQLINCLEVFKLYNKNVDLAVKLEEGATKSVGKVRIVGFNVGKDAQTKIKITGIGSELNTSVFIEMIGKNIKIRLTEIADV